LHYFNGADLILAKGGTDVLAYCCFGVSLFEYKFALKANFKKFGAILSLFFKFCKFNLASNRTK
jgi:hypothetical protein